MATTASRKRLSAQARRDSILAVAISEFVTAGYERTRVAEIARRVGVTEPVVFQNFGTKAGLFAAVLEQASEELARHLQGDHGDAAKLVSLQLDHEHQDRLHSHGGLGVIFAHAAEVSEPSIRLAVRRAHRRTMEAVAAVLRRGQSQGTIREDVEAITLAGLVLSQIHARHFRRLHGETSAVLEKDLRAALLAVLRPPPGIEGQGD